MLRYTSKWPCMAAGAGTWNTILCTEKISLSTEVRRCYPLCANYEPELGVKMMGLLFVVGKKNASWFSVCL
jgi:hypothetical protein